ncbi:MAG: hypothetical protein U0487_03310 [Patescibacteria group bacterium]
MMTLLDRRMLDGMQAKGLLDSQSRAFAVDLLQQGCTLEQALLGTKLVNKSEFIDELESLGVARQEYDFVSERKPRPQKLRSLNTEIESVLRNAVEKRAFEVVFIPTKHSVRVMFGQSADSTELPKAMYPALAMRLRRWGGRLGWEVKEFRTHGHDGIRLIRAVKRASEHPAEQSEVLKALRAGQAGLYVFVQPDAYVVEQYFLKPAANVLVFDGSDEEAIESALHEALFGGTVLVSIPSARPAWWQLAEGADVPVYLYA